MPFPNKTKEFDGFVLSLQSFIYYLYVLPLRVSTKVLCSIKLSNFRGACYSLAIRLKVIGFSCPYCSHICGPCGSLLISVD